MLLVCRSLRREGRRHMTAMQANRRQLVLGAGATIVAHSTASRAEPTGWFPIPPQDAAFAPDLEPRLDRAIAEKRVWNLHGVVVLRNDRLVLERYFEGEDQARGIGPIGHVIFTARTPHDLRSC